MNRQQARQGYEGKEAGMIGAGMVVFMALVGAGCSQSGSLMGPGASHEAAQAPRKHDTTPPVTWITNPVNGSSVTGLVLSAVGFSMDNGGVQMVQMNMRSQSGWQWSGSGWMTSATDLWFAPDYTNGTNTLTFRETMYNPPVGGIYTLKAKAMDVAGNQEEPGARVSFNWAQ